MSDTGRHRAQARALLDKLQCWRAGSLPPHWASEDVELVAATLSALSANEAIALEAHAEARNAYEGLKAENETLHGELRATLAAAEAPHAEDDGIRSAYDGMVRALEDAHLTAEEAGGPYWEDGIRALVKRAEAAEAELARLRAKYESDK